MNGTSALLSRCESVEAELTARATVSRTARPDAYARADAAVKAMRTTVVRPLTEPRDRRRLRPGPVDPDVAWATVHAAEEAVNVLSDDVTDLVTRAAEHARHSLPPKEAAARVLEMFAVENPEARAEAARELIAASHARSTERLGDLRSDIRMAWWLTLAGLVVTLTVWLAPGPDVSLLTPPKDSPSPDTVQGWVFAFGAVGGLVAAMVTFLRRPGLADSRWVDPRPALTSLKVVAGALLAFLAVFVLGGPAGAQFTSFGGVLVVALLFGYSQQVATRLLDDRVAGYVEREAPGAKAAAPGSPSDVPA